MQGDVEAQVVARQRPLRLERVDVLDDEAEARRVARGQREVVATQRVLREVPDHRARLHAEQRGGEHRHHVAHAGHPGHRREGGALEAGEVGEPFGSVVGLAVVLLHRGAERGGERLEHAA